MKLDEYLEVAEEEVNAFQQSIDDMASFQGCSAVFSTLIKSYSHSIWPHLGRFDVPRHVADDPQPPKATLHLASG